jgi:hypothetical protein
MFLKDQAPFRLISGSIHYHRWAMEPCWVQQQQQQQQQQHQQELQLLQAPSLSSNTCNQSLNTSDRQEPAVTCEAAGATVAQQLHHHAPHNRLAYSPIPLPQTPPLPLPVFPRIPPAYWVDRLARVKAMGCNAIQMYVPWNWHQPTPEPLGPHSWSGWRNITRFIQMAGDMGLLVLLRPGPYVCAGEAGDAEEPAAGMAKQHVMQVMVIWLGSHAGGSSVCCAVQPSGAA